MTDFVNKILCGDWVEVLKTLPGDTFHCCMCSPPYWAQRNYGVDGQLGLEKTPEEHIDKLVAGFCEVRRVLRPDGVLWLNYGDKYWGGKGQSAQAWSTAHTERDTLQKEHHQLTGMGETRPSDGKHDLFGSGDLLGLPWRVAFALQADGWWLRSDIVWAKALSFCPTYSGSTMPESVNGWRWERHRVKVKNGERAKNPYQEGAGTKQGPGLAARAQREAYFKQGVGASQWADCPGCAKCEGNGGLILRRGSWRCTKAHEYLFMLTRSANYYCDMEAVKEDATGTDRERPFGKAGNKDRNDQDRVWSESSGRNLRDCWVINPQAYKGSHYATYPEKLVEPCIKVSTSQKGCCPKCGAPWARVIKSKYIKHRPSGGKTSRIERGNRVHDGGDGNWGTFGTNLRREDKTLGWRPTCNCNTGEPVPALVLDPFFGSGTTGMVAARLGRNYTGIELSAKYIYEQAQWRVKEGETGMRQQEARQGQQALFE